MFEGQIRDEQPQESLLIKFPQCDGEIHDCRAKFSCLTIFFFFTQWPGLFFSSEISRFRNHNYIICGDKSE